jgi:exosome complex exonuclease RRP6
MDITSDFQAYHDRVTKSLVEVVRAGGQISNTDLSFHRSSDKISRQLDQQNARLLRLTNKLLKAACQDSAVKPPALRDQDAVDDNWRGIVSVVDDLLEKSDVCLDEFTGAIRRMSPAPQEGVQTPPKQPATSTKLGYSRVPNQFPKVMYKPQMHFKRKVNNINPEPFKPLLFEKPHAIKSLEESIGNGPEQ